MSPFEAVLLGLVQGLTEFLPVSSDGHLVIAQHLMGIVLEGLGFEVTVHVATLASVLLFYRQRLLELAAGTLSRERWALEYVGKLALATLPAVVLVLIAGDFLEAQFESPRVAGAGLLFTGCVLITTRRTVLRARASMPSWTAALLIGCAQALAILPGVSRSGSTVAVALALGVAPVAAAEFSFLMSVPAILGAAVRTLPELTALPAGDLPAFAVGFATALVSGIGAIWLLVRLLRQQSFHLFAYYTWAAGALFLLWLELGPH